MKKLIPTIAASLVSLSSASGQDFLNGSDSTFFINPFAGYAIDSEEAFGGVALGIKKGNNEFYLQYGLMRAEEGSGFGTLELDIDALTVGYTYNGEISNNLNGYLGGSLGIADVELSTGFGSASDQVFYFDLKAGLDFEVSESLSLQAGVRYFNLSQDGNSVDDVSVELGAKFRF